MSTGLARLSGGTDPNAFGMDGAIEFPPHKLTKGLPQIYDSLDIFDEAFEADAFDGAREINAEAWRLRSGDAQGDPHQVRRPAHEYLRENLDTGGMLRRDREPTLILGSGAPGARAAVGESWAVERSARDIG